MTRTAATYMESKHNPLSLICQDYPIGSLGIAADGDGICAVFFKGTRSFPGAVNQSTPLLEQARRELDEYFSGTRREFDLPLSLHGTPFQKSVWRELLRIPYGQTATYGELAERIGNPKACRAVGMANNRNPIVIIVPCHRVIGADGSLTGYAGGLDVKQKLLELERMALSDVRGML